MVRNEERSDCSEMSGYGEHPNRKCISGSDGGLIPARSRDHTGLWLLSVAKLIAKVWTCAADFCSKESPAEPMTGKPLQNLRVLQWLAELHFLFECSPEPEPGNVDLVVHRAQAFDDLGPERVLLVAQGVAVDPVRPVALRPPGGCATVHAAPSLALHGWGWTRRALPGLRSTAL